ncbi:ABC transporter ATP-binding protein [Nocardioides agariphilus]|uniref:ABC transporter ATP-binding protein n=1 Tax=Nocardioides agariphilus TaxID=433664 RepID=A0A930VNB4_9ACTN|nr:ABC transporter ATP-binding protein [Nocardioides agariphilus]MBF4768766.1 ABC transporter ATP-binding protein [Nocardioides agariphilus]
MKFGENLVLDNVSLSVKPGEFTCLIGASGCGKSTLLNLIAGFTKPTSGTLRAGGELIKAPGPERAMVFQDDAVFPWYTVHQNVEYGLKLRGVRREERHAATKSFIKMVGLEGREKSYPSQLSGGMRKRVDVARAIAVAPRILLMDEPFAALDAITKARMQEEFLDIWEKRQTTVIFVTHDIEEALFLGDRIVLMGTHPGRILSETIVPFARPRSEKTRTMPELQELRATLLQQLRISSAGGDAK